MCHENTPHTNTPAAACITRQDGSNSNTKSRPYHPNGTAEMETHQTRQCFLLLSKFCELQFPAQCGFSCCSPSASWFNMLWIQSALLHTLVVMSGYLNYSCFAISPKQSAHSPLTCGSILAQRTATHRIFCLFQTILRKPQEMPVFGKSPVISNF